MAELGIIASVVQIADVGLRLSVKLYTFGEIVASADRSVISISKDVSLTSGVLKELGQILDKDKETRTFSENAVQTADGVVKECLEVFQEMENILVKKMPSLAKGDGRDGRSGERTKRATVILERLKWGYLQPKLQLLRSNLDRLKSTLLLMLNVITYARQVSGKTESPSVIAEQRSLIEDLAHSNQEYIRKFEKLKLGIEGPIVEHVDDASNIGAIDQEPSTTTRSLPGSLNSRLERVESAVRGIPLQDKENTQSLGSREFITTPRSLAIPPHTDVNKMFINTSVHTNIAMPPIQQRGIPTTEAPMGANQEVLFKQLEHYSMLINNLLKEVDEAQYKITFKSRLRVKDGITGLHESERQELERMWGGTALQSAEQRLESLVKGLGEMPRMNRPTASEPQAKMESFGVIRRTSKTSSMVTDHGLDSRKQDEATSWIPRWNITRPTGRTVGAYARNDSVPESDHDPSDKKSVQTSDSVLRASTDNPRSEESSAPVADVDIKTAEDGIKRQGDHPITSDVQYRVSRRPALNAPSKGAPGSANDSERFAQMQISRRKEIPEYDTALGEQLRRGQVEFTAESREKVRDSQVSTKERGPTMQIPTPTPDAKVAVFDGSLKWTYFEPINEPAPVQTPNPQTLSPKHDMVSPPHTPAFDYLPMPVTSADDAPYMASYDDPDVWSSLFSPIEEKRDTTESFYQGGQSYTSDSAPRIRDKPLLATIVDDPNDAMMPAKRARNTMAARKSRKNTLDGSFVISAPENPVHVTHVGFENETGQSTGLPKEWQRMLQESGISKMEQEKNPQALVDVMTFYKDSAGGQDEESTSPRFLSNHETSFENPRPPPPIPRSMPTANHFTADMEVVDRLVFLWTTVKPL